MKILILGSGSFAGQAVFSNLISNGYEVFGINRSGLRHFKQWPWLRSLRQDIKDFWYEIILFLLDCLLF